MLMFLFLTTALAALVVIPRYRADQERWRYRQRLRKVPAGRTFLF